MPTFTMEKLVIAVLAIIGFILLAIIIGGLEFGSSFYYLGCEGSIGGGPKTIQGESVRDNPRCTALKDQTSCELSTYKPIERDDENITVCVWLDDGVSSTKCYFNGKLACEDFSQTTVPRCQDMPDCRPVSAVKAAVYRLKPAGL